MSRVRWAVFGLQYAHNCNGKAVSCCTPQGPSGTSYCYKKNAAVKEDLGSAGCCSSQ